ncbi:hypothetical protein, partial [Aeromonas media]|uniref:hypothetical protein n=1 Tax=Aeromonas media TaxID=651 RepID=UPI0035E56A79
LRIRVFTLAGMAVQLRRNTHMLGNRQNKPYMPSNKSVHLLIISRQLSSSSFTRLVSRRS